MAQQMDTKLIYNDGNIALKDNNHRFSWGAFVNPMIIFFLFFFLMASSDKVASSEQEKSSTSLSTVDELMRLSILRMPATIFYPEFLYTVLKENNRIGLLTYDGLTPFNSEISQIDYSRLTILECGPKKGSITNDKAGYVNYQDQFGVSGYGDEAFPCRIARNANYQWFTGDELGENIWYSRNENNDIQCLSFDGRNCLMRDNPLEIDKTILYEDVDFPGNDILSGRGNIQPNVGACVASCLLNSQCNSISYVSSRQECWIKKRGKVAKMVTRKGIVSAFIVRDEAIHQFDIYPGRNLTGSNFVQGRDNIQPTQEACASSCLADKRCSVWSYIPATAIRYSGYCFLKNFSNRKTLNFIDFGDKKATKNAVTGVRKGWFEGREIVDQASAFDIYPDSNLTGNNFVHGRDNIQPTQQACANSCLSHKECTVWAYFLKSSKRYKGYCFLKNFSSAYDLGEMADYKNLTIGVKKSLFSKKDIVKGWSAQALGVLGDLYRYDNPYTKDTEYFKLVATRNGFFKGSEGNYGYFPTNKTSNDYWKFMGPHKWDGNSKKGVVGDIYRYDNPYTQDTEYFKLLKSTYWYFPTNKKSNYYWKFMGPHKWDGNSKKGVVGDIYRYKNPYTKDTEYFKLLKSTYWYFPTNKKNNHHWKYISTNIEDAWEEIIYDKHQKEKSENLKRKVFSSYRTSDQLREDLTKVAAVYLEYSENDDVYLPSANTVSMGKRVSIKVQKSGSPRDVYYNGENMRLFGGEQVTFIAAGKLWMRKEVKINENIEALIAAVPVVCQSINYSDMTHWCTKVRSQIESFHRNNMSGSIRNKEDFLASISSIKEGHEKIKKETIKDIDDKYLKLINKKLIEIDLLYKPKYEDVSDDYDSKKKDEDAWCHWLSILWGAGAVACAIVSSQADDLKEARDDLKKEWEDKKRSAKAGYLAQAEEEKLVINSKASSMDYTHLEALIKEEKSTLKELKKLKVAYDKDADIKHKAYLAAMKKYRKDSEFETMLLTGAEAVPLLGPEVKHIADYVADPSALNFRRMLLGTFGPVGEALEGGIELATGEGGFDSGKLKLLEDVLTDLTSPSPDSFGKRLEKVMADTLKDLGDITIGSLRQAGLWSDHPGTNLPMSLEYEDVVELRAQSERYEYDPWQDMNTDSGKSFQDTFGFDDQEKLTRYISHKIEGNMPKNEELQDYLEVTAFYQKLTTIFTHSFGENYAEIVKHSKKYKHLTQNQVNLELYKVIRDSAYYDYRVPHWVTSKVIGHRPAGLLYDNEHSVIVYNSGLLDSSNDLGKFYFEELGHMVNWWRCKIFDVSLSLCSVHGDAGARFRDAIFVKEKGGDGQSYQSILAGLSSHSEVDKTTVLFKNGKTGQFEGWPDYYTLGDHVSGGASVGWSTRMGVLLGQEGGGLLDQEFDIDLDISWPTATKRGEPWKVATCKTGKCYCKTDEETNCNVPTMWLSLSFRDSIDLNLGKAPKLKNSKAIQSGTELMLDLIRYHGGKLPFQLKSVHSEEWEFLPEYNIYFKKFLTSAIAQLDILGMFKGLKESAHNVQAVAGATLGGSFLVEIATKDKADFAGWLAGDITSAIAGGFVLGAVSGQDPVLMCHAFSDLAEIVETAFQSLDKKPTSIFGSDVALFLPTIDYYYSKNGLVGRKYNKYRVSNPDGTPAGTPAGTPNNNPQEYPWYTGTDEVAGGPGIERVQTRTEKIGQAFKNLKSRSFAPIALIRLYVNFPIKRKIVRSGEYNLPVAITATGG
jgi:hypothetical protein